MDQLAGVHGTVAKPAAILCDPWQIRGSGGYAGEVKRNVCYDKDNESAGWEFNVRPGEISPFLPKHPYLVPNPCSMKSKNGEPCAWCHKIGMVDLSRAQVFTMNRKLALPERNVCDSHKSQTSYICRGHVAERY